MGYNSVDYIIIILLCIVLYSPEALIMNHVYSIRINESSCMHPSKHYRWGGEKEAPVIGPLNWREISFLTIETIIALITLL